MQATTGAGMPGEKGGKEMIEKLEQRVIGANYGCGGASFSEVIAKVNEVIDALNQLLEKEDNNADT